MRLCILHNQDHELLENDPGREARRDVIEVAGALAEALEKSGMRVCILPVEGNPFDWIETVQAERPNLVVNLCESLVGDSRGEMAVPCMLDLARIPYTGSDALALGLALHKDTCKEILCARGIPTPPFQRINRVEDVVCVRLEMPLIVKPSREDASVGIDGTVVKDRRQLAKAVRAILEDLQQPALVEQYLPGREIYVSVLGNRPRQALPLSEIRFGKWFEDRPRIVSYRAKWDVSSPEFVDSPSIPCQLDPVDEQAIVDTAMAAFEALDCRDYGRVDFRLDERGRPHVIDINPNCDLHPDAGFARAAHAAGMGYPALALRLVEIALERSHGNTPDHSAGPRAAGRSAQANRNLLSRRGEMRARAHRRRASAE